MLAGGKPASRVARWDGTQFTCFTGTKGQKLTQKALVGADWHAVGLLNGDVHALAVFGEYVFAGGDFTLAGTAPCRHLARFYSGDWIQVG